MIGTSNIGNTATTRIDLDALVFIALTVQQPFESSGAESVEIGVATAVENTTNSLSFSGGSMKVV